MIRTVSLETAKLLKEAGFRQDTSHRAYEENPVETRTTNYPTETRQFLTGNVYYAAPTTDELLEELPDRLNEDSGCLNILKYIDKYLVIYDTREIEHESLPEALAQMWLYLKKSNLLSGRENE